MQYARFLAFKCSDPNRAVDILKDAVQKSRGSKVLFLSYCNFLKHLEGHIEDVFLKVCQAFEKAIDDGPNGGGLELRDRMEIAKFYFDYV